MAEKRGAFRRFSITAPDGGMRLRFSALHLADVGGRLVACHLYDSDASGAPIKIEVAAK
jgi:hypothetical protein